MALFTQITTEYTPDVPRELTASYRMDRADRTFLDAQVLGVQQHLSDSLIRGQIGSNFQLAATSAALAKGDVFCAAPQAAVDSPSALAVRKVTKATATALAAAGIALGIAMAAALPGGWVRGAMEGIVGSETTGLAAGSAGFVRVSSTGRPERVGAFSTGDSPLGYVDGYGNLSLLRERPVSAGAGGGGYGTVQDEGTPLTVRSVINFVGAGVTAADIGSVTTVTIPGGSGPSGSAVGQTQIWNGSAWTAGALDLTDVDARTGTLPIANGGTGLTSAGGVANRALVTTDGTTWAAGLIALTTMVSGLLPFANFADGSATSVFGRAGATSGAQASIAATADGQVMRRAGGALAFGAVDLADADAVTGLLPFANLPNGSSLSVFGRSANTAGVMASIAGTSDQVLRVNTAGTALAFGTIATAGYTDSSVTLAKLANGTASSVLGRSAATAGVYADIVSSADGQVFRRGASGVLGWGAVDLADTDAVTGLLPFGNVASLTGLSVLGRSGSTSGVMAAITGVDGQVLRVSGTTLGFGTVAATGIADGTLPLAKLVNATASSVLGRSAATGGVYADIVSSADGQVLRRGASGVVGWGAVDLTDTDAVTGALPFANIASVNGPSVLGRDTNVFGVLAPIIGTANLVLRVNATGTSLAFGTITNSAIATNTITYNRIAQAPAASVVGNLFAATGDIGDIVSTVDGQVLVRASGGLTWGAVDLADADAVTGQLPFANLPNGSATSVFGRSLGTAGVMASIAATADGQVLTRVGGALAFAAIGVGSLGGGTAVGQVLINSTGNVPTWGAVDLADADATTGTLAYSRLPNLNALSVLGNATNAVAAPSPIAAGSANQILRVDSAGLSLAFGTIQGSAITTNTVAANKLAQAPAASVLGNFTATTGDHSDFAASADGQVLTRVAGGLAWGAIDLADTDAVSNQLAFANVANLAARSVLGRASNTTGVMAAITGTADQVLAVNTAGTALAFAQVQTGGIATSAVTLAKLANATASSVLGRSAATAGAYADIASSADGQVLRRGASGVIGFGAIDLADADAVSGLLALANLAPSGTNGRVLVTTAGAAAWAFALGNSTDAFTYNAASHDVSVAGTRKLFLSSTSLTLYQPALAWDSTVTSAQFGINSSSVVAATGVGFSIFGQDVTGTGATVGGAVTFRAGNSTNGTGGSIDIRSGAGLTATQAGNWQARLGNTVIMNWAGADPVALSGTIRLPITGGVVSRNQLQNADIVLLSTNTSDGVFVGDAVTSPSLSLQTLGARLILGTNIEIQNAAQFRFDSGVTGGVSITHEADSFAGQGTANKFSISAQSRIGTGTTTGAELELASGTGTTAGATTIKVGSTVMIQGNDMGAGREVLGLFSAVTTTQMPANTGKRVLFWNNTANADVPTTGSPVGGGILYCSSVAGLAWKGTGGVVTTLAMHGGTATTKGRFSGCKVGYSATQPSGTSVFTACSFTATDFFQNGTLMVRAKSVCFGSSTYSGYCEQVAMFRVDSGVVTQVAAAQGGFDDPGSIGNLGNGHSNASIDNSGTLIRFRVTPFASLQQFVSYFEVDGCEDGT